MKGSFWALPVNKLNWNPWYYWISRNVRDWPPVIYLNWSRCENAMSAFPAESCYFRLVFRACFALFKVWFKGWQAPYQIALISGQLFHRGGLWQSVAQGKKNCVMNIQMSCNRTRFSRFLTPKLWQWTPVFISMLSHDLSWARPPLLKVRELMVTWNFFRTAAFSLTSCSTTLIIIWSLMSPFSQCR